jgi:hypothetical protein
LSSVHLKGHYVGAGLAVIKKWKKQSINGSQSNLKPSSPIEWWSLLTTTKSVCNCRETVLKNRVTVVSISLCLWLVQKYCLYFVNCLRTLSHLCQVGCFRNILQFF